MIKTVAILFIVCYPLFVFYTREPDFSDSDYTRGTIHVVTDSLTKKEKAVATFTFLRREYTADAYELFANYREGEPVDIIYHTSDPANAKVYSIWGYWIRWGELLSFLMIFIGLYQIAVALTSNPTPESLIEELEGAKQKPRRKRYDD